MTPRDLLGNRSFLRCLGFLASYQAIRASSTLFLAQIFQRLGNGGDFRAPALAFMATILVPYVPWSFARRSLIEAAQDQCRATIDVYCAQNWNQPEVWGDRRLREERNAFISKENSALIRQTFVYLYDAFSLALDTCLSLGVLIYVSDPHLLLGYALAVGIMMLALSPASRKVGALAAELQRDQVRYDGHLQESWDNVILGNAFNYRAWVRQLGRVFTALRGAEARMVFYQEGATSTASALAILVIFATNYLLVQRHAADATFIAVLAATLPKQIAVITNLRTVSYYVTSYSSLAARFAGLNDVLARLPKADLFGRVTFSRLTLGDASERSVADFASVQEILSSKTGRFALRGGNGAGKSTLLRVLKGRYGAEAYYLPANHRLFFDASGDNLSTGQAMIAQLDVVLRDDSIRILLLDEWDANLDSHNKALISDKIDRISSGRLVVEVSHRA